MKNTFTLFVLLFISQLTCFAQVKLENEPIQSSTILHTKISTHYSQKELEHILEELSTVLGLQFSYSKNVVPINQKISINLTNQPLETVLKELFTGISVTYEMIGNRIILKKDYQLLYQTIRGTVADRDTKTPIIAATVIIKNSNPLIGAVTDTNGSFKIERVPLGRLDIMVSYLGYENETIPNILIGSGKEVVLSVELVEAVSPMEEVVISATRTPTEPVNEMAVVSTQALAVEETGRYAATLNDPARMVASSAGVAGSDYLDNAMVIRGNSSRGVLWRLEGVEIPNPNHFADEGASSGGISVLNANILSQSNFLTGAFPAPYGNALSGVLDISLRKGNNQKREYTFQAGALGLDASMEGPFRKGGVASYVANYRYATFSLLNKLGFNTDEENDNKRGKNFQDASFKIHYPTRKAGTFSFFGVGGLSQTSSRSDTISHRHDANMAVVGASHQINLNSNTFIKSVLSLSGTWNSQVFDSIGLSSKERFNKSYWRTSVSLHKKISAAHFVETGAVYSRLAYDFQDDKQIDSTQSLFRDNSLFDAKGNSGLLQSYVAWKYRISNNITFISGLHLMYFGLSTRASLEPRGGLKWQLTPKQAFSAGFGVHSRIEPLQYYFARFVLPDGNKIQYNKELDFTKARHYVIGYDYSFSPNWQLRLETYYQDLYNIPVRQDTSSIFSAIAVYEGFSNFLLVNKGRGTNYGVEVTLQKFFSDNYYFIINGALYSATYKALDGISRNTPYNGNFNTHLVAGREFRLHKDNGRNLIGIHLKATWAGGKRYIPIDLEQSMASGREVFNFNNAYSQRLSDYIRADLQIHYRLNHLTTTSEWRLDIFNVANHKSTLEQSFDPITQTIAKRKQLGILPVLNYKLEF